LLVVWRREGGVEHREILGGQAQVGRTAILAHMRRGARSRDGDQPVVPDRPGERQLGRRGAVAGSDTLQHRISEEAALLDRRVRHHRQTVLLAPGQEVPLDATMTQIVEHLVGDGSRAAGDGPEVGHVVGVEVADAEVTDLARPIEHLERRYRFGERDVAAPMQQVEVEPVRAQTAQALLAGDYRPLAGRVARKDLAYQEDLVSSSGNGLAHQLLGGAVAVHPRGVDQGHAEVEPEAQRG
jgi:hypothetical protein